MKLTGQCHISATFNCLESYPESETHLQVQQRVFVRPHEKGLEFDTERKLTQQPDQKGFIILRI